MKKKIKIKKIRYLIVPHAGFVPKEKKNKITRFDIIIINGPEMAGGPPFSRPPPSPRFIPEMGGGGGAGKGKRKRR